MTLHTSATQAIEITLDEAKDLLARAVEEKGSTYVYEQVVNDLGDSQCLYFNPATRAPSCIVGHVLAYKGVTYDDMFANDVNTFASVATLADTEFIKVDNKTQALLSIAQGEQDQGQTWGNAVQEALETYEETASHYRTDGYDDVSEAYVF